MTNTKDIIRELCFPDIGTFTQKNDKYFVFKKNPQGLRSKYAMTLLLVMITIFVCGLIAPTDVMRFSLWAVSSIAGIWFLIENRYFKYYTKAANYYYFSRYKKAIKYLDKLVSSKYVYTSEMPLAYYILKAKQLLESNDYALAEYITKAALEEYGFSSEMMSVNAICSFESGELFRAKELFYDAAMLKGDKAFRVLCAQMYQRIGAELEEVSKEAENNAAVS